MPSTTALDGRVRAVITGTAGAYPPGHDQGELWDAYFSRHYAGNRWARRVFLSAGVEHRHCAFDPTVEDLSSWSTGRRMARYAGAAVPLAAQAASSALGSAGVAAEDLGLVVVASCTGYVTPGVDIFLAAEIGMSDTAQRLLVGHVGCHAAVPALACAADYVAAHGLPALVVCVEVSTLHIQPPTADLDQVVIHALFGDAAAAAVVEPRAPGQPGLAVADVVTRTAPAAAALMTWEITDTGFVMGLDRGVPEVLGRHVAAAVDELLARNRLARADVAGWAVHPGGPRVLDVVADRLGLAEHQLDASRYVLARRGNCSSATVLVVLDELRRRGCPGPIVALTFGPGLTVAACLLRA